MPPQEDVQNLRVCIVKMIYHHKQNLSQDPGNNQLICSVNDDQYQGIMLYNNIMNHIVNHEDEYIVWKFKHIFGHEGPLKDYHPNYKKLVII